MTLRDEIDALPEKPKPYGEFVEGDEERLSDYNYECAEYERAHRAMAERLLREWLDAAPMDSEPRGSTRAYFAKREAET